MRGDAAPGTIARSTRGIDGALAQYQLPFALPSVSGFHLGHAQRACFPLNRSRGFAASAFGVERHSRRFAASASPEPARPTSSSPAPPFPLDTSKLGSSEPRRRDASAVSPGRDPGRDDGSGDEDLKVDLHALDRAKAEIDRLHLERQIKEAVSTWNKAVSAWESFVSLGPYAVSLTKMTREEWRIAASGGWHHFKDEMAHYWAGTKLLWVEIKIATRLLFKTLRGQPLTRRERKQMTRTTADVFRLVPFAAFILIPFMEVFLPVAIKLFPGMLPTTFRDELKHEEELKKRLKAKLEVARFLQDTVKVMAKGLKQSRSGYTREKADDLYDFMKKVRSGDATVTNDDITRFSRLFGDEFTLDHISRGQLTNMCKFVGLSPYGTDSYLRRQLKDKLKELKSDDKVIAREGVASLSVAELQSVSRARGMRADTADRELLERQINDWLELSLNAKLPPSLLVLSRAFTITTEARRAAGVEESETVSGAGDVSWDPREDVDALAAKERQAAAMKDIQETLATLPEEVVISVTEERQMASSRADQVARKLEFLEQEEELIEEENAERAMEEEALREERAKKEEATKALAADGAAVTAAEKHGGADAGSRAGASPDAAAADAGDADAAAKKDLAAPGPPAKKKADTGIDSVSLDEVESVVAGRRARRAAKLSRLLAALAGVSALGVERKELTSLVRKELDLYGKRLRQVQKQLVRLDGDAAVAAAVAAEGDVAAAAAIEAASAKGQPSVFSRVHARTVSPESLDGVIARETASYTAARAAAEEEERFAEPGELVPDEDAEAPASPPGASGAGFGGSLETSGETWTDADADASRGERLADPFEVVDDEDEEEEELSDLDEKPGWFRASHDARLCDRVNDRVNAMLAGVKRDLDLADDKIGTKFKVLDADGDGKISPEELVNVKEMLKDALDDEDEAHLRSILSGLETDANGMIDVADLSALVGELVEKELRASEIYDDDDHDEEFELGEEARKGGAGDEDAKAAGERREGQP